MIVTNVDSGYGKGGHASHGYGHGYHYGADYGGYGHGYGVSHGFGWGGTRYGGPDGYGYADDDADDEEACDVIRIVILVAG